MFKHADQAIGDPNPAPKQDAEALALDSWAVPPPSKLAHTTDSTSIQSKGGYTPPGLFDFAEENGPNAKFDGTKLCNKLRDEMERVHRQLRDPGVRSAFHLKWTPVCQSPRIVTEAGADDVARDMIASVGERFDHYFDRSGVKDIEAEKSGAEIGIGINTQIRDADQLRTPQPYAAKISSTHPLEIIEVYPGSPAAKAGLRVGDRIMEANGVSTDGLMRREVLGKIEGETGTQVKLKIQRALPDGTFENKEISAKQKWNKTDSASYQSLGDGVGYVKIRNFMSDDVVLQTFNALGQTSGDKAIVIDLRNNNGGRVSYMEQVAEYILSRGSIYKLEQRKGDGLQTETRRVSEHRLQIDIENKDDVRHTPTDRLSETIVPTDKPIVILIDEYSASAAELLAGILKGNKRAKLVGVPSTGKSEGQEPITLPYGRQANLTDFEFYPAEQPVPHTGLEVDVEVHRGTDPIVDNQRDTAKEVALKMVTN